MTLDALTPNDRMAMYEQYNSPTENAGVEYVTNPNVQASDKNVSYLAAIGAPKNSMLSSMTTPTTETPAADLSDPTDELNSEDPFGIPGLTTKPKESVKIPYKAPPSSATQAYNYYVKQHKLPPHVAAGIIGNLYRESGLRTDVKEQGGTGNGRGIAQWDRRDRWPAFLKWAKDVGKDAYALTTQLDYILVEPGEGDRVLKKLMNTKTVDEATMVFGRTYERPNEKAAAWGDRKNLANSLPTV